MNLESFENEIAKLESQLRDAIAALRALKDIQATFQDMQPRYERLKQLTDEAARLPQRYAQQFETARQQAENRLAQLETQSQQQQADWQTTVTQHERIHQELRQHLHVQETTLESLATQQQSQTKLQESTAQSISKLHDATTAIHEHAIMANTNLKIFVEKALQDQAQQLREGWTAQFKKAFVTGLLAGVIGLGAWIFALFK